MDRDALREKVAEAMWRADLLATARRVRRGLWVQACEADHLHYRPLADAALAVIEPAVRADIARELDCGCDCRDAVLAAKTRTEQRYACGRDPCSALEAREIRGCSNGG